MISTQVLAEERVIVEKTRGETYTGPPIHTAIVIGMQIGCAVLLCMD